jgi:hypothetical protein
MVSFFFTFKLVLLLDPADLGANRIRIWNTGFKFNFIYSNSAGKRFKRYPVCRSPVAILERIIELDFLEPMV